MSLQLSRGIVILSTWLISCAGYAGDIVLKTELWDFICKVEVAVGPQSPGVIEKTYEFPGVQSGGEYVDGIVFIGEKRLCYRRSSVADDCYSEMNDWVCYTNYREESETILIY